MLGSVIAGLTYRYYSDRNRPFPAGDRCFPLRPFGSMDDNLLQMVAVAEWLVETGGKDEAVLSRYLCRWTGSVAPDVPEPGVSITPAARAIPCGLWARSIEEAMRLGVRCAEVTDGNNISIIAAEMSSASVFFSRQLPNDPASIETSLRRHADYMSGEFGPMRDSGKFSPCDSVWRAMKAFGGGRYYNDCVKRCLRGYPGDYLASLVTGALAETFYPVAPLLRYCAFRRLDERMKHVFERFYTEVGRRSVSSSSGQNY